MIAEVKRRTIRGLHMNVLVFASRKGGTGKSTLAAHLAAHVAKPSRPTLLIDADPQAPLALVRAPGQEEMALKRSRSLAARRRQARGKMDVHRHPAQPLPAVVEAIRHATLVVIPTRPSLFDLAAVRDTIDLARTCASPMRSSSMPHRPGAARPKPQSWRRPVQT